MKKIFFVLLLTIIPLIGSSQCTNPINASNGYSIPGSTNRTEIKSEGVKNFADRIEINFQSIYHPNSGGFGNFSTRSDGLYDLFINGVADVNQKYDAVQITKIGGQYAGSADYLAISTNQLGCKKYSLPSTNADGAKRTYKYGKRGETCNTSNMMGGFTSALSASPLSGQSPIYRLPPGTYFDPNDNLFVAYADVHNDWNCGAVQKDNCDWVPGIGVDFEFYPRFISWHYVYYTVTFYKSCPNGEASYNASNMVANSSNPMGAVANRYDPAVAQTRDCVSTNPNCISLSGNLNPFKTGYNDGLTTTNSSETVNFKNYVNVKPGCTLDVYRRQGSNFAKVQAANISNYTPAMLNVGDEEEFELVQNCGGNRCRIGSLKLKKTPPCDLNTNFKMKTILDTSNSILLPYAFNDGPEICVKKNCNGSPNLLVPSPSVIAEPTTIFNWVSKRATFDFTRLVSNSAGLEVYRKDGANDRWFLIPNPAAYQPKSGVMLEKFALVFKSTVTPVSTDRCFIGMIGLDCIAAQRCLYVAQKGSNEQIDQPCYVCNKSTTVSAFAYMKAQLKGPCIQGTTNTQDNTVYNLNGFAAGVPMNGAINESVGTLFTASNLVLSPTRTAYNITVNNVESISPLSFSPSEIITNGLVNNFYTFKWVPAWNQNRNQSNYIFSTSKYSETTSPINFKSGVRIESYNPNGPGNSSFVVFANSNIILKQPLNDGNPAAGPGRRPGDASNKFYSIPSGSTGTWVERYTPTEDIADLMFTGDTGTTPIQCMTFRDQSDRYELKPADTTNPLRWMQTLNGVTSSGLYQLSSPGTIGIVLTPVTNVPIFLTNFNKLNGKRVKICTACPTINFNDIVISTKAGVNTGSDAAIYANVQGETSMNVNLASRAVWPCTNPVYAYDVDIFKLNCTIPGASSRIANPNIIIEAETELKPSTFPNPFTTELNIKFTASGNEDTYFEVFDFDLQGKKMYNSEAQKLKQGSFVQETVDTASWAAGMYIIKTYSGNGESSTQKVIKQ